jgi:RHS repeat-associated protein
LLVETVNDNQNYSTMTYDGLTRLHTVEDSVKVQGSVDNTTTYTYDKEGNVIERTEAEVNPNGTTTQYVARTFYDELNRITASIESTLSNSGVNLTTRYAYDSLGNEVFESDALNPQTGLMTSLDPWHEHGGLSGSVNAHGNTVISTCDDAGRLLSSVRHMRQGGVGGGGVDGSQCTDGKITIAQTYDRDGRVTNQTDDNSNTTHTDYDVLNRPHHVQQQDSTGQTFLYNQDSLVGTLTDADGTQVTNYYDNGHRLTSRAIAMSPPVSGTTAEVYTYDGTGRMTSATNQVNGSTIAAVTRGYDSLSRVVKETINGKATISLYDGVGNLVDCTYPGLRHILRLYDRRDRLQFVKEGLSVLAQYQYAGRGRVYTRDYLNGTRLVPSYDEVRRINGTDHTQITTGVHIDRRSFAWDRASNKIGRTNLLTTLSHTYTYDSQYRMVQSVRSQPAPLTVTYSLDGVHNRGAVTGGSSAGTYIMSAPAGDFSVNQYTSTPWDNRTYDNNGNLTQFLKTSLGTKSASLILDYRNEMIQYNDLITLYSHSYAYDALGRRISKTVRDAAGPHVTNFYYIGWQVIEEQDNVGTSQATYVYGNGIDEVLSMRRGGQSYYYHADDEGNVMKITGSTAGVQETNDYGDYGELLDGGTLAPKSGSTIGNPYFFAGARLDSETGLYYMRARYFEPRAGRFITRDPLGVWGDGSNIGNGLVYAENNPWTILDPLGLYNALTDTKGGDLQNSKNSDKKAIGGNTGAVQFSGKLSSYGTIKVTPSGHLKKLLAEKALRDQRQQIERISAAKDRLKYSLHDPSQVSVGMDDQGNLTVCGNKYDPTKPEELQAFKDRVGQLESTMTSLAQAADSECNLFGGLCTMGVFVVGAQIAVLRDDAEASNASQESEGATTKTSATTRSMSGAANTGAEESEATTLTAHGRDRVTVGGFTEGEICDMKASGPQYTQSDGAKVFIKETRPGKFTFIIDGRDGLVTARRDFSQGAIDRLAKSYGWKGKE